MKNPKLLLRENLKSLSLEALGLLVVHAYQLDRNDVSSSNVTFEAALDELKEKKRIQMISTENATCPSCH